jgi:two-component sensor histidine kinase
MPVSKVHLTSKHKIDFSLVPAAIILIEISVFFTQLSEEISPSLLNLILMRIIHTAAMVLFSFFVSWAYKRMKKTETDFHTLAITGILVMALGDLTHSFLASIFDIELVSIYRRIGIVLIQGGLWFPAFIIFGGNRREIFDQFKQYENKLIISTRARGRTSPEFKDVQRHIQNHIRADFYAACSNLKELITQAAQSGSSLQQQYAIIQPHLAGEGLRKLSRELENSRSASSSQEFTARNLNQIRLFFQEFKHLYASIAQSSPLHPSAYALVLIALVTPPFINFYSVSEFLISYPILLILIFTLAQLIVKAQTGNASAALRRGSILIGLTGLLPAVVNFAGQAIYHDPKTRFPLLIMLIALPVTYYLCMELFQVLRPSALSLARNDKLKASDLLQQKVTDAAIDDYSQYLYQQWATFIHGKILTRLAATSLKLQEASRMGDLQSYNAALQSLSSLLSKPDSDFEEEATDLHTEVISRLAPWRGLLEISVFIDQDLKSLQNSRVRSIGEVIEEVISNSIRHGKAKKIDLRVVRAKGDNIEILAVDNATIPPPKSQLEFGLGTRIFNFVSDGRWSLTRIGLFTEFKLTMAIDFQEE